MMRIAKIFSLTFAGLVMLLVGCALFVYYYDWSRARPEINSAVSAKLHRQFAINGPLSVTWTRDDDLPGWRAYLPRPHIEMQDVTLANPDAMQATAGANLASVDKIAFSIDTDALFDRQILLPALVLEHPQANLRRDAAGKNNWTLDLGPDTPSIWRFNLHKIVVDDGHIDLQDDTNKLVTHAAVDTMDDGGPEGYGIVWKVDGSFNKAEVKGQGKAGGVQSLEKAVPYPVEADMKVGKTSVSLKGTLTKPSDLAALDLHMKLSGASMADLFPLTGITLPDTPPFSTQGHLTGTIDRHGGVWEYDRFTGKVGSSDLSGNMRYESAGTHNRPRPLLEGTLVSNLLRFSDLGPVVGADQPRKPDAVGGKAAPGAKVLPDADFKFTRWRAIDADVSFTGRKIVKDENLPIDNLVTHIVLRDGTLSLLPLQFGVADGRMTSNIKLNGNGNNIKANMDVSARHLQLNKLMPDFKPMQTSFGEINGDAKLDSTGNSVATLLGASNGELKLLVNQGSVSKLMLEESGLNVINVVMIKLFGDSQVKLNCVAGDFVVTNGLMQTQNFLVDTDNTRIGVNGKVDLAKESLDLTVQPENKKFRLVSLRTPVYVDGTFADPHVDVDRGKLVLRTGGAIALGILTPPAALLPLVDVGPGKDSDCAKAIRDAQAKPKIEQPNKH